MLLLLLVLAGGSLSVAAQQATIAGRVVDEQTGNPLEFVSILLNESGQWAVSDDKGRFHIKNVPLGKVTLSAQCLGYQKRTLPMNVLRDVPNLTLKMKQDNLKLDEVTVVAKRKQDESTTSYTIDRTTLDNQQILNISDISTLLPGGKTVNPSLMDDNRLALRSGSQEKGNASFGTAIEVDGMRMDNNAAAGETMAASTRTISSSNIESVEIVTGIPSVEYGDLSNGVVKVNTRKGKSPFVVEGKLNQHTRQIAVNKGFDLEAGRGILNVSLEHAQSFSNAASPYTSYKRNILGLHYMNIFFRNAAPLTLNVGLTGNVGGYNSKADPDNTLDNYAKVRDNAFRGNLDLQWLLNKPWLTNLSLKAAVSYSDRKSENYTRTSSASSQPYIHVTEEGYHIAEDYNPATFELLPSTIVLGPTGYWYVLGFNDSKPLSWSAKLKAENTSQFSVLKTTLRNRLLAGIDYAASRNNGRGAYYSDMSCAPTWREYRYDEQATMHNLAFYAEDKVIVPTSKLSTFELTAGLRNDLTLINGSDYGTVSSLSPRANARYVFWRNRRKRTVSDLQLHAGYGKSVKLPSFQVLYPAPSYSDVLAFTPGSTADNRAYYAYYTYPTKTLCNPDLKWQYTYQADLGIELTVKGTRLSLSGFYHKTFNSYMSVAQYTPYEYKVTGQAAIEQSGIASENRRYSIDPQTGIVTLSDLSGTAAPRQLDYTTQRTYNSNRTYVNGSPIERWGLEWIVDFAQVKLLHTSLRLDGNYYRYHGIDETLLAGATSGTGSNTSRQYPLIGYYRGSSSTTAGTVSSASLGNGSESEQLNLNATLTTHVPKLRMIVALRIESSLRNYRRQLCELADGSRGIALNDVADYFGTTYDKHMRDQHVAVYPEYYATWDNPGELIPFAAKLAWARDNDQQLYNQLARLVVKSNYPYMLNPNSLSNYYSANLSVTKEIGDHVSVSFYANNFFNNMGRVRSSQTGLETSLFDSGYIPSFYYGLSLRLHL